MQLVNIENEKKNDSMLLFVGDKLGWKSFAYVMHNSFLMGILFLHLELNHTPGLIRMLLVG